MDSDQNVIHEVVSHGARGGNHLDVSHEMCPKESVDDSQPEVPLDQNVVQVGLDGKYFKYSKRDVMAMIIGQKYRKYPQFTQNIPLNVPLDLYKIENNISNSNYYDEDHLQQDLHRFKDEMTKKFSGTKNGTKVLKSFNQMFEEISDELENFNTCAVCIRLFYTSNRHFIQICRPSIHNLVLVRYSYSNRKTKWWPAKCMTADDKDQKLNVIYFGNHETELVPYDRCILLSLCRLYHHECKRFKKAYDELLDHIRCIQNGTGLYFHGYPCLDSEGNPGVTFSRKYLYLQKSALSTEPLKGECDMCALN